MKTYRIEYETTLGITGTLEYISRAKSSKVSNDNAIRYAKRMLREVNWDWKSIEAKVVMIDNVYQF